MDIKWKQVDPTEVSVKGNSGVFAHSSIYSKGGLKENQEKGFKLLWTRMKPSNGIPLVKWQAISKPKEEGEGV